MRVLVLGGAGFIGRHVALALADRGHTVVIGSRHPGRAERRLPPSLKDCERREAHLERLLSPEAWNPLLGDVDVVVNAVGILRERGAETYARVHHFAPGALAAACARRAIRVIHVSALGLHEGAKSGFLRSKLAGERAVKACGSDYSIVRPSLLDGEGGYGALWLRRAAALPVHFVPADAAGRIAVMDVRELGIAVAELCEMISLMRWREVELGGSPCTMAEHLAALRGRPALRIAVPGWLARAASHLCDLLHFSPYSFGHLELMRRDNMPHENLLPVLLHRASAVLRKAGEIVEPAPVALGGAALSPGRGLGTPAA